MSDLSPLLGEGSLKEEGASYTFFWKGYPTGGQHLHGVGLAIENCLLANLIETSTGINKRLMSIRIPFAGKQYTTLLSVYAPTLPSEEDVKDRFYEALGEALHKAPKSNKPSTKMSSGCQPLACLIMANSTWANALQGDQKETEEPTGVKCGIKPTFLEDAAVVHSSWCGLQQTANKESN